MARCKEDRQRQPQELRELERRLRDIRKILTAELERRFSRPYWRIRLDDLRSYHHWRERIAFRAAQIDQAAMIAAVLVFTALIAAALILIFLIAFGEVRSLTGVFIPSLLGVAVAILVIVTRNNWRPRL